MLMIPFCNWVVLLVAVVHFVWGATLILVDDVPPPYLQGQLRTIIDNATVAGMCYVFASGLAIVPFFWTGVTSTYWHLLSWLPQQFLLVVSASIILWSIIQGKYPVGVTVDRVSIVSDQIWELVTVFVHTGAILDWCLLSRYKANEWTSL
jgi:hypothetical protein